MGAAADTQDKSATSDLQIERGPDPNANLQDAAVDDKVLNLVAQEGNENEHSFGFIQGFKTYKRAAFWSVGMENFSLGRISHGHFFH